MLGEPEEEDLVASEKEKSQGTFPPQGSIARPGSGHAVDEMKVVHSDRSRQAKNSGLFEVTAAGEMGCAAIPEVLSM